MKSFLKFTLASIVGVLISSLIVFLILIAVAASMVASAEKEVTIESNSILKIELNKPIPERTSENPFENFDFKSFKPAITIGLTDIIKNIKAAKTDSKIRGIYLDLSTIPSGYAVIEEIRNALLDFKTSKKFIISYADTYTHGSYYLASVADSVFLNPLGELTFLGLRSEQLFFKGTLEKLDIEPQIIRHGKFKSAVEPLINEKMSEANREQLNTLLTSVWGHMVKGISEQRKISATELNRMADEMTIRNARAALTHKLIDGIRYKDEVLSRLSKLTENKPDKDPKFVTLSQYNKVPRPRKNFPKDKIAILYACGDIVMGKGDDDNIGSDALSEAIRSARRDSSIKAIVLRINSPGGSAQASDIIWRELSLAAKSKPLIVSMGAVAASGGYYIAAPADTIVADPTTITGSIGVFGVILNAKNFFNKKLGVTSDVAQTNKHADLGSIYRPLSAEEKEVIQAEVENIYDVFVTRVSSGRKMTKTAVDAIGQGRVWSATDAKRIGLVDILGGLDKAIEIAAKKAKLKDYRTVELPKTESPFSSLMSGFSAKVRCHIISSELGEEQAIYQNIQKMLNRQGVLTRMPYDINFY